jgi:hypothetical protein
MVKSTGTTDKKTRTSVVLGNDYFPQRTTYQTTYSSTEGASAAERDNKLELAEVLPLTVYPPPTEPLKRTIYREDFGGISNQITHKTFLDVKEKMKMISGIHLIAGVPLSPHADVKASNVTTEPSQQQTGYKNKTAISSDWAKVQKMADNEEIRSHSAYNSRVKIVEGDHGYEKLPTEHQRQFRWPLPDDIHVVTYQQTQQ